MVSFTVFIGFETFELSTRKADQSPMFLVIDDIGPVCMSMALKVDYFCNSYWVLYSVSHWSLSNG
uniref:Uncharacterized protein n=1 Tax=Tetranychus urticae TaxID=32264 RepID=T1JW00_TETUR